ncbi:MAG TPA: AAA family ATPase [Nitrososphaerales archaeon]|nr:AAA family ATPase [Nitrososphaerales archaeon]
MINPFRPGNGIEPKYLAGRQEYIESFEKSLKSYESGLPRNAVLSGLRGTGKTVLLKHFKIVAEARGWITVEREFGERFSDESAFAEAVANDVVSKASEISLAKKIKESGRRIFNFAKPAELGGYGVTYKPYYKTKKQLLDDYLKDLFMKNWNVFEKSGHKGVVFLYDEFHTVRDRKDTKSFPLGSLLGALSNAQRNGCNYYLCLSGLPIVKSNLKQAKTYTERMFDFREVGNLSSEQAREAVSNTLGGSGHEFEAPLIERIVSETRGYPYFLQFYGYFAIESITKRKVSLKDFLSMRSRLIRELDASFFEGRFNAASSKEKAVLEAIAKIGEMNVETNQIIRTSKIEHGTLMQLLIRLVEKGLLYRSSRGKYSFTLPLFRDYLLRH